MAFDSEIYDTAILNVAVGALRMQKKQKPGRILRIYMRSFLLTRRSLTTADASHWNVRIKTLPSHTP